MSAKNLKQNSNEIDSYLLNSPCTIFDFTESDIYRALKGVIDCKIDSIEFDICIITSI